MSNRRATRAEPRYIIQRGLERLFGNVTEDRQVQSGFAGTKQVEVLTSPEARRVYSRAGVRARKEIVTGSAFYALQQYARKRPLTFAGRVIGHTLGPIGIAFWAYDAYSLVQYFRND